MSFFLILTACNSSTLGAGALSQLDALRALVEGHATEVQTSQSLDSVSSLEGEHSTDMSTAMNDMDGMMANMMGCSMSDMMNSQMSDANTHMAEMMVAIMAHPDAQNAQTDLQACWDEEDAHLTTMHDHLDGMEADIGGFDDDARCSGSSGGMM